MPSSWYPIVLDDRPFDADADADAEDHLADQRRVSGARRPALTITSRLLQGPEVPELRAVGEEAQLLVLGARGNAGRARIGRVSAHLAAHARCTVAVVRQVVDEPAAPMAVGVDGSPSSLVAVRVAAREALYRAAALANVHARPTMPASYGVDGLRVAPMATADENDPTHRAASSVAATLRAEHLGLDARLEMVDDDPAHALTKLSRGAALLVVGSRGMARSPGCFWARSATRSSAALRPTSSWCATPRPTESRRPAQALSGVHKFGALGFAVGGVPAGEKAWRRQGDGRRVHAD